MRPVCLLYKYMWIRLTFFIRFGSGVENVSFIIRAFTTRLISPKTFCGAEILKGKKLRTSKRFLCFGTFFGVFPLTTNLKSIFQTSLKLCKTQISFNNIHLPNLSSPLNLISKKKTSLLIRPVSAAMRRY